jgi:ubiquinone/menaquinone biosynthesis C-methylase UbiE
MIVESNVDWSLRSWKQRHENGYFPNSEQHRDWKVYDAPPNWLMEFGQPTLDDQALEIGCGYGEWMIPLSRHVGHIWGIDIHYSLLEVARNKFIEHGVSNAEIDLTEGLRIPFPDGDFSLVYSISVFQHIPRAIVRSYLQESARVLQPMGRMLHHFRNADNQGPYPELAKDIAYNHRGDFSVGWTAAEVKEAGDKTGLRCRVIDIGLFLILIGEKV